MSDITQELGKKIGPLPLGAWAILVGGGIGIFVLLSRRNSAPTAEGLEVGPDTVNIQHTIPGVIPQPIPIYQNDSSGPNIPGSIEPPKTPPVQTPKAPGNTGPMKPGTPTPPKPTTPAPTTPQPRGANYPGLPAGYVPDPSKGFQGLHGTYETVLQNQKSKGQNNTFTMRNMVAIALYGTPTPWVPRGDWNNPASINQRRVAYGLIPLTSDEISQMLHDVDAHDQSEQALASAAPSLFNRWNFPYQTTASNTIRKTR